MPTDVRARATGGILTSASITADDAEGGILVFNNLTTTTTAELHYTTALNFSSGTLFKRRVRDGATTTQSVSGTGTITATGLVVGERYDFWVLPINIAGNASNISNIVTLTVRDQSAIGNEFFEFMWKGDKDSDWHSRSFASAVTRRRIRTSREAHYLQWRMRSQMPGFRLKIRNVQMEVRLKSLSYSAESQ